MSLEEEIEMMQFGQGIRAEDALTIVRVEDREKWKRLFKFCQLIEELKPSNADIEPAIANSGLQAKDAPCLALQFFGCKQGLNHQINLPRRERGNAIRLMLALFKIAYQRQYSLEKDHSTNWWFRDLSDSETTEGVRAAHQQLVEEIYNDPGFRAEFACMAKLWNEGRMAREQPPEPAPTKVGETASFLTYDELMTSVVRIGEDLQKYSRPLSLLSQSMHNALSIRCKLNLFQTRRLLWDVVERHSLDQYHTRLFS